MFLPFFGEVDEGMVLNLASIAVFLLVYLWHIRHDHRHNDALIDEVKKIRSLIEKDVK